MSARVPVRAPAALSLLGLLSMVALAAPTRAEPPAEPKAGAAHPDLLRRDAPRCPAEMALVDDRVCVDRWEAHLVERTPAGADPPRSPFEAPPASGRWRARAAADVVPQAYIDGRRAALACLRAGKRLCRAGEWERACRGPASTTYPYGDARRAHVCNDDGRALHPVVEVARQTGLPSDRMWYEGMESPLLNQLPDTLSKTGAHPGCTNAYGTFDMVGNLHEWIDDPAGTFRGGFYLDTRINGEGCDYATTAHNADYHDYSTGFRCCLDADRVE